MFLFFPVCSCSPKDLISSILLHRENTWNTAPARSALAARVRRRRFREDFWTKKRMLWRWAMIVGMELKCDAVTVDEMINIVLDALKGCVQGDSVGKGWMCDVEIDEGKLLCSCGRSGYALPRIEWRGNRAVCECINTMNCLFEKLEEWLIGSEINRWISAFYEEKATGTIRMEK